MQRQNNSDNFFKRAWLRHPILLSICGIILSFILLGIFSIFFLDIWTHHGSTTVVPNVINKNLNEAVAELEKADLEIVISDSVYTKGKTPGSVVDIIPEPGSVVKSGREVYLTIVAFTPEKVTIDMMMAGSSVRSVEAYLKAHGLRVQRRYVPYEYNDIVVDAKCNGKSILVGSRVSIEDIIVLEVGKSFVSDKYMGEDPLEGVIGATEFFDGDAGEENIEAEQFDEPESTSGIEE